MFLIRMFFLIKLIVNRILIVSNVINKINWMSLLLLLLLLLLFLQVVPVKVEYN